MKNMHYPFQLPPLYFPPSALEPYISAQTMELHHGKHFRNYVEKLNALLEPYGQYHDTCLEQLICQWDSLPADIRTAARNNGGGCFNHDFYFRGLSAKPSKPQGPFLEAIRQDFGSFDQMKRRLAETSVGVFGSGWGWLCYDKNVNSLCIIATSNQDTPYRQQLYPIVAIDVWEHAYYLDYQNKRADYVDTLIGHIDWEHAGGIYRNLIDGGVDTPF